MVGAGRILTGAGLAGHRRQGGVVEDLGRALRNHHPQPFPQHPKRLRFEAQPAARHRTLHQMGRHQPAAVGHCGIEPGHLNRRHRDGALADGGGDGVDRVPGLTDHLLLPGRIPQQTGTLLVNDLHPGVAAVAQAAGRFEQLIGPQLEAHLVVEAVAAHRQGLLKADGAIGAMVAVALAVETEAAHGGQGGSGAELA